MGTSISVRELKIQAVSIVRRLRKARRSKALGEIDRLAAEVSAAWSSDEGAVETLVQQRDNRAVALVLEPGAPAEGDLD